jgi:hypothetical protein
LSFNDRLAGHNTKLQLEQELGEQVRFLQNGTMRPAPGFLLPADWMQMVLEVLQPMVPRQHAGPIHRETWDPSVYPKLRRVIEQRAAKPALLGVDCLSKLLSVMVGSSSFAAMCSPVLQEHLRQLQQQQQPAPLEQLALVMPVLGKPCGIKGVCQRPAGHSAGSLTAPGSQQQPDCRERLHAHPPHAQPGVLDQAAERAQRQACVAAAVSAQRGQRGV